MQTAVQLQPEWPPSPGVEPPILRLIRYLGRHLPNIRGKHDLVLNVLGKLVRRWPQQTTTVNNEGISFLHCDLGQYIYRTLFVFGVYEPDVDWMARRLLRAGDTVVDIGACFGYHSLSCAARVAPGGRVYAIEPQPDMYAIIAENLRVNALTNVHADCLALSDQKGRLQLHRFPDLDVGYASISNRGHQDFHTVDCRAETLDEYVQQRKIGEVTLLKLDVEGAELKVLRGALALLESPRPSMWIVEINRETAGACGYRPEDMLSLLKTYGYSFYRPRWGKLLRTIRGLEKCAAVHHGENILCAIEQVHHDRLAGAGLKP